MRQLVALAAHVPGLDAHLLDARVHHIDMCLLDGDLSLPVRDVRHALSPVCLLCGMGRASLREMAGVGVDTLITDACATMFR